MNIFYALLQQQKVHLLHLPPEELQQWPGNFNRIKRTSRSADQNSRVRKKNWLSTWLHTINFGSDKIVRLYVRPFMLADVKCLVGRPFFSAEICKKIKWLQFWQKVIKYLLNKFTFQGDRSVLLKGESLYLFLPRPSAMIYNVDYFWIIMYQLSVGMGHSLSMLWELWVKRVYNFVILGAEESVHEWFSDESWEHRILLRTPSSRHRRCHPG